MKQSIVIVLLSLSLLACNSSANTSEVLDGELSFELIEIGSYYALADGLGDKIFDFIDSLNALHITTLSSDEKEFLNTVNLLEENNLLFLPSFRLKTDSGNYRVYVDSTAYPEIEKYKREELVKNNTKVQIILRGRRIDQKEGVYFPTFRSHEFISIKEVPGKTYWRK